MYRDNYTRIDLKMQRPPKYVTIKAKVEELGITQGSLSQYERGTRYPSTPIWIHLSEIFKVSVDELMGIEKGGAK